MYEKIEGVMVLEVQEQGAGIFSASLCGGGLKLLQPMF
jgi:hypothetical protein